MKLLDMRLSALALCAALALVGCGNGASSVSSVSTASATAAASTPAATAAPTIEPTPEPAEIPVDFASLQAENPDIYAWITIPGTKVDYPILQNAALSDYYLDHNLDGSQGLPGCLYTQNFAAQDFSDKVTTIYGHNMKNDSMFGSLHDYDDESFFKENNTFEIYTPEHIYHYRIFAAVNYSSVLLAAAYDFDNPAQYQAFLDSLDDYKDLCTHIDDTVEVTPDDNLVVMSTCVHSSSPDYRYLVIGVLEETE